MKDNRRAEQEHGVAVPPRLVGLEEHQVELPTPVREVGQAALEQGDDVQANQACRPLGDPLLGQSLPEQGVAVDQELLGVGELCAQVHEGWMVAPVEERADGLRLQLGVGHLHLLLVLLLHLRPCVRVLLLPAGQRHVV